MFDSLRYLLLQARNPEDPMRGHEVKCFARALRTSPARITVHDLLSSPPPRAALEGVDIVLLGGSGDYSVAEGGPWLEPALDAMRELHDLSKPTFASCWGFQAFARAMGGVVVTDLSRAELGTLELSLTPQGRRDPVFGPLGDTFPVQIGHADIVDQLPPTATRLASSDRVENEAFTFPDRPIYCTQFHPELSRAALIERIRVYPTYVEKIAQMPLEQFIETRTADSNAVDTLLTRFVEHVMKG